MNTRQDWAELECNGATIDAWTSYSAQSDLFTSADSCKLSLGVGTSNMANFRRNVDRLRELLKSGTEAKLWISSGGKRALQGVFVSDGIELSNDADSGTQLSIEMRDRAMKLFSAADPKLYTSGDTLVSVARKAVAPWGIEVTADHVAARDLRQARVTKDKLSRLQRKARSYGIPPRLMSEKIAASIDRGTITFDDFVQAQAGGLYRQRSYVAFESPRDNATLSFDETETVEPLLPGGSPLRLFRGGPVGIPYSGATGLSSLKIYQLRVQDIRPQNGETRWEFLDRSARRNGLLMSMTPDGKLLFCGLHYDQAPSYRITRRIEGDRTQNNVISGGWRLDTSNVYSDVVVYGRAKGKDKSRSPFKGHATTGATEPSYIPFPRTHEVRDNSIRNKDDAQKRAEYELAKSKQGAEVLEYTLPGHSQNGLMFAPDTVATIVDEVAGINGNWYVTARTFTRSGAAGPMTNLKLVPIGSIVLGQEDAA